MIEDVQKAKIFFLPEHLKNLKIMTDRSFTAFRMTKDSYSQTFLDNSYSTEMF